MSGKIVYSQDTSRLTLEFDTLDVEDKRKIYNFIRESFKAFDQWVSKKYPSLANNIDPDKQTLFIFNKTYGTRMFDELSAIGVTELSDV